MSNLVHLAADRDMHLNIARSERHPTASDGKTPDMLSDFRGSTCQACVSLLITRFTLVIGQADYDYWHI